MAPPAIPEGDRHRALRLLLPDDVLVQLFNNLRASRRSIARGLAWPAAGTRRGAHLARFERDAGAGCRDLFLDRRHLDEQRIPTLPRGADRAREEPGSRLRGPRPAGMAPTVPRTPKKRETPHLSVRLRSLCKRRAGACSSERTTSAPLEPETPSVSAFQMVCVSRGSTSDDGARRP